MQMSEIASGKISVCWTLQDSLCLWQCLLCREIYPYFYF
jgi:hypothetical protein